MQSGGQAQEYCDDRGWNFRLITERELRINYTAPKLKGSKVSKGQLREKIFEALYDNATEQPEVGKWYFFEYDPKWKDILKKWDEYPLIKLMEIKKDRLLVRTFTFLDQKPGFVTK